MTNTVGQSTTARANANIAFIKYWGNIDDALRLPANPSISMNLDGLFTQTTVTWREDLAADQLTLNGQSAEAQALRRVSTHLDALRQRLAISGYAAVESANNFPTGAGIASSAAAFAALTIAAAAAAGLTLSERELTTLARLGSGSASRSVPSGFVEWYSGATHEQSFAESIASPDHWDIVDVVAIVSHAHKTTGSSEGHQSANSSDYQTARVAGASDRLVVCKRALLERDFATFAEIVEHDSNMMHAVMMTSRPPLFYWQPATLGVMEHVRQWRADGLRVCYTLDAGPNVHCICVRGDMEQVREGLKQLSDVQDVLVANPGGPAQII
ncbi:MAG: diphosphomevalonate decarboxylase [Burkholderiales bacterium]|nr:diphosphomevalonate decarboxylase [Anaerolineae bacterium]